MTKIAWVDDNLLAENPTGGAEATNDSLIKRFPYPVTQLTPSTLLRKEQLTDNDVVIFSNTKWFSNEQMEWMLECETRAKFEHDYWNLVIAEQEKYKKEFWEGCGVCIFHSPRHLEEYSALYPNIEFKNIHLQPSSLDIDSFYSAEKEDISIYVGSITIHKGVLDSLAWAKEANEILHVWGIPCDGGYFEQVAAHPNCKYEGTLDYSGLIDLYARAKRFVFLPVWVDPFARTVVETRLSGCEQIINDRIGALSYDWWNAPDEEYKEIMKETTNTFWNILDRL